MCAEVGVPTMSLYMGKAEWGPQVRIFLRANIAYALSLKTDWYFVLGVEGVYYMYGEPENSSYLHYIVCEGRKDCTL